MRNRAAAPSHCHACRSFEAFGLGPVLGQRRLGLTVGPPFGAPAVFAVLVPQLKPRARPKPFGLRLRAVFRLEDGVGAGRPWGVS